MECRSCTRNDLPPRSPHMNNHYSSYYFLEGGGGGGILKSEKRLHSRQLLLFLIYIQLHTRRRSKLLIRPMQAGPFMMSENLLILHIQTIPCQKSKNKLLMYLHIHNV